MFPNVQWGEGGIAPLQANQCPHDGNKELAVEPGLYIHKSKLCSKCINNGLFCETEKTIIYL